MTQPLHDINITAMTALAPPTELLSQLPVTPKVAETIVSGRDQIKRILSGEDHRMLMIVGPCSIHDEQAGLEYAGRLVKLAKQLQDRIMVVMRVYFEKPRTTVGWKGLIYDPHLDGSFAIGEGLHQARAFLLRVGELGLPAATEFLDPIVPQYLADLVSWAAIGARTTESQTHRQMASGLSMPVGFKNTTDGNTQYAVDAIVAARAPHGFLGIDKHGQTCMVLTKGNPHAHLVLRGGSRGANYNAAAIAAVEPQLAKAGLPSQLLVDCSHGNSDKDYTRQCIAFRDVVQQRVEGDTHILGCMLESHLMPGSQKLEGDPSQLRYGVSITDACIGWEETEQILTEAYQACGTLAASAR